MYNKLNRYDLLSKELDLLKQQGRYEVLSKDQQDRLIKSRKWPAWTNDSTSLFSCILICIRLFILILSFNG